MGHPIFFSPLQTSLYLRDALLARQVIGQATLVRYDSLLLFSRHIASVQLINLLKIVFELIKHLLRKVLRDLD